MLLAMKGPLIAKRKVGIAMIGPQHLLTDNNEENKHVHQKQYQF
jgi:hypothetical protein